VSWFGRVDEVLDLVVWDVAGVGGTRAGQTIDGGSKGEATRGVSTGRED
jgi:hypothetical protein